ncbi:sacsin N-terminal ATP-binding-like domain-containing protein [Yinghuangia aomiensis]
MAWGPARRRGTGNRGGAALATQGGWIPDAGLVREVDTLFERAIDSYRANPNLITEHANHEESIRVGGYSKRTLLELVQNAADAMAGATGRDDGTGRVEIVLDLERETLYCANSGRPFSPTGLTAIAHAHLSAKRGDEIGRFGLGFKSVLAVTDSPQVFSRSISFGFNSPEAKRAIAAIGPGVRRLPVLRTATRIDASAAFDNDEILADLATWASTIVRLPGVSRLDDLKREIRDFASEFLLFVNDVREVRLRVLGAEEGFETSHLSRALGDGHFRIERPGGDHDEWFVENRMHQPGAVARAEVGEAVSRDQVKVTVAIPARFTQRKTGEFWSYFPLQDRTSASALFNAPWSVNDDRTTLLENTYNREILVTLSSMFVEMLPRVSSSADEAAHLDYMPARGRESLSFGDKILCAHVPRLAAKAPLIPDATGALRTPPALVPLDFDVSGEVGAKDHRDWCDSPNTGDDVPHWRCYTTPQRATRLRAMYVHSSDGDTAYQDIRSRDETKALASIAKRGILSWLREWAEGTDPESAARALEFVVLNPQDPRHRESQRPAHHRGNAVGQGLQRGLSPARRGCGHRRGELRRPSVPGDSGRRKEAPRQRIPGAEPGHDPPGQTVETSLLSGDQELSRFWDAVLDVPMRDAEKIVARDSGRCVKGADAGRRMGSSRSGHGHRRHSRRPRRPAAGPGQVRGAGCTRSRCRAQLGLGVPPRGRGPLRGLPPGCSGAAQPEARAG